MTRERAALLALFAGAAALRLHNAWAAPPLTGSDGPYHAAYVGIVYWEGRLPLLTESWSTYHPPLYYALAAGLWALLPDAWGPHGVLVALRLLSVAAGLGVGVAVLAAARQLLPQRPRAVVYAVGVTLFVPMLIPASSLLGNDALAAALCAAALALLLRALERPGAARGAALGAALGLALLAKLTALPLAAASLLALFWRALREPPVRGAALRAAAAAGATLALVSGGFFARNWVHHGSPLLLEVELSADVMRRQGYGPPRPLLHYLDLSPHLLVDPAERSARARRAVWPATFAAVWFDLHGQLVRVQSEVARGFAHLLFLCGGLFAGLAGWGGWRLLTRREPAAVPAGPEALLFVAAATLAAYVAFTYRVATFSTLKGPLLAPALGAFALFCGAGCDALARRGVALSRWLASVLAIFAAASAAISAYGWLAPTGGSAAPYYLRAFVDPPTQRAYDYFVRGRAPRAAGGAPGDGAGP